MFQVMSGEKYIRGHVLYDENIQISLSPHPVCALLPPYMRKRESDNNFW